MVQQADKLAGCPQEPGLDRNGQRSVSTGEGQTGKLTGCHSNRESILMPAGAAEYSRPFHGGPRKICVKNVEVRFGNRKSTESSIEGYCIG